MPTSRPRSSASTSTERLPFHQSSASRPLSPGRSTRGLLLEHVVDGSPAAGPRRASPAARRSRRTSAKMSPTADWPASKPNSPGTTPSSTTPHMPSTRAVSLAEQDVADARTHDHHHAFPARSTPTAGAETCASTFATATGVPGDEARPARPPARSGLPARSPSDDEVARHLLVDHVLEARDRAPRSTRPAGSRPPSTTSPCSRRCSSHRVSTPVSCQTIQSAASISRSARS